MSVLVLGGCSQDIADEKVHVVSTVGMLGDMVRNVGGDLIEVTDLMGPGVDPHLYKPSASDIALIDGADVVFYVGIHLEAKMAALFEDLEEQRPVYAVAGNIDESLLRPNDPHIWFDVDLWASTVAVVVDALSEFDPKNAEVYEANGEVYFASLMELDQWVEQTVEQLPRERRVLITAHDAFGYFGDAYGFDVLGVLGISTASDFGLKDLEELIEVIVDREVPAIFVETSVSDRSIRALMEGAQAEGQELEIGGSLFSDAMGERGTLEGTYIGMVKHNVTTIVDALK